MIEKENECPICGTVTFKAYSAGWQSGKRMCEKKGCGFEELVPAKKICEKQWCRDGRATVPS